MQPFQFDIDHEKAKVFLKHGDERREISPLWLRERCQSSQSIDQRSQQRYFNPHFLPEDLEITRILKESSEEILVSFTDGSDSIIDLKKIREELDPNDGLPDRKPWNSQIDLSQVTFNWDSLSDSLKFHSALEVFLQRGFLILNSVPTDSEKILDVASLFGHPRRTNFGQYFEVYSRPGANDLAYSSHQLDPHTDNPYREPVPGVQLLHCLINETKGGYSTLADSLSVTQKLKEEYPESFDLLSSTPVRFRFFDQGEEFIERRPLIQLDSFGQVTGVNYSPRLDSLNLAEPEATKEYHRARRRLGELLKHKDFEKRLLLGEGDLLMFDNKRLLHGRTSFDPQEGRRHLQGCYIDIDEPRSRYRKHSKALLKRDKG